MRYQKLGDCAFEPSTRTMHSPDSSTILEPRIVEVLEALIEAEGPIDRRFLLDHVWGITGSDEALTQAISRLRRILGDTSRPYRIIKTVPRVGYELCVEAVPADDLGQSLGNSQSVNQPAGWLTKNWRYIVVFAAGALTMVFAAAIIILTNPPQQTNVDVTCYPGSESPDCQQ